MTPIRGWTGFLTLGRQSDLGPDPSPIWQLSPTCRMFHANCNYKGGTKMESPSGSRSYRLSSVVGHSHNLTLI